MQELEKQQKINERLHKRIRQFYGYDGNIITNNLNNNPQEEDVNENQNENELQNNVAENNNLPVFNRNNPNYKHIIFTSN